MSHFCKEASSALVWLNIKALKLLQKVASWPACIRDTFASLLEGEEEEAIREGVRLNSSRV